VTLPTAPDGDWIGRQSQLGDEGRSATVDKLDGKDLSLSRHQEPYKDSSIKAEFWADDDVNRASSSAARIPRRSDAKLCYEVNIFDKRPDPSYGTGAIVDVAKVDPMPKAGGKWNTSRSRRTPAPRRRPQRAEDCDVQDSRLANGHSALQYGSGVLKWARCRSSRCRKARVPDAVQRHLGAAPAEPDRHFRTVEIMDPGSAGASRRKHSASKTRVNALMRCAASGERIASGSGGQRRTPSSAVSLAVPCPGGRMMVARSECARRNFRIFARRGYYPQTR